MVQFSLASVGLETVADAAQRKGWGRKTLLNWINAGLLVASEPVGPGRGTLLVKVADVDAFTPPVREDGRGRPLTVKRGRKPKATPEARGDPQPTPPPQPAPTAGKKTRGRPRKASG